MSAKKEVILPKNTTESKLLKIYQRVLKIDTISMDDSFYDLGGDSLTAIKIEIAINQSFNVDITVKNIFERPILKDLAKFILDKKNSMKNTGIKRIDKAEFYPVSSSQKSIYLVSKMTGSNALTYNIPGILMFDGKIDEKKLEECLAQLIKRHESLRTYFEIVEENIVQKVADNINFKLQIAENEEYKNIDSIFKQFVKEFDLSKAPLFRAKYVKFKNNKSCLLVDMHHIISDGATLNILTKELCKLYENKELRPLNITYKDYASYSNNLLENGKLDKALKYWEKTFADEIPVLNLPTNYPRPAVQSFEGKKVYTVIDEKMTKQISNTAKNMQITPFMLLIACYYILLSKYTSQEDIIIGTPFSGRTNKDINNLVGMFVNTLPLRNKVSGNLSFKEFIQNIKKDFLETTENQYPFDELVSKLNIKRDTSRNPLFDTMFIYQNRGFRNFKLGSTSASYYIPDTNTSKYDLSLEAVPEKNKIKLSFEYATSLFNKDFITNLSNHYINIVKTIIENNEIKIDKIDMLSEEEKDIILNKFNDTFVKYPDNKTVIQLFEEQVKKTPEKVAVTFEKQQLTYRQLNNKANSLAQFLIKNGLEKNQTIGLFLDKSLETIIAIIATLKCSCVYMPIDVEYPFERIQYMVQDSETKFILTMEEQKNKLTKFENVISIDLNENEIYNNNIKNINFDSTPEDVAYIMYTSGSTGRPKGVMVSNKNIVRLVKNNKFINFEKEEKILQTGSIVFDASTFEIWATLLNGFELFIIKKQDLLDADKLQNYLIKNKITILWVTAPLFNVLSEKNPELFKSVRILLTGGDVLSTKHINLVRQNCPNLSIINGYGPTENTTFSTCFNITKKYTNSIPIGYPISNSTCYIVSKSELLQPIGVPGELYVGGDGVSKGYLKNEENTSKKFIKNIFGQGILYKTGDLAKWNDDGSIEFIGRIDNQVKIRGFRVELNEINVAIKKVNKIKDCVTLVKEQDGEKFLCTYFSSIKKIESSWIKDYLKDFLPYYAIPKVFIRLDKLPLNVNGKIDVKALPVLDMISNSNNNNYYEPQTELQKKLVKIWEKVLKVKNIGIKDNFFDLGGDSLLAMSLNVELKKLTNNIEYQDIFRYPTIEELEQKILSKNNKPFLSKIQDLSESFNDILKNSIKLSRIYKYHPKGIVLTGVTGFLGIHLLEQFIKKYDGNIYCIIREEKTRTSKVKLHQKLNYYFGDKYDDLIDKRIFAVTGDITKPGFGLAQEEILNLANSCDVLINCAANVAHYGNYIDFYNTNVQGVKNSIEFCKSAKMKLYHISTMSVSGVKLDYSYPVLKKQKNIKFNEDCLYVGQNLDNVYIYSKFQAELQVLEAINSGLDAYIMRMGNLMPRLKDGKFQQNISSNAFMNRIKSFCEIGYIPNYLLKELIEFTPIDVASRAIFKIVTHTNNKNRIFHLYNHNYVSAKKLINKAKSMKFNINILNENQFKANIQEILNNEEDKSKIEYILNDLNKDLHLDYKHDIISKSNFTVKYLRKTFFKWPKISNKYLSRFIKLLKKE